MIKAVKLYNLDKSIIVNDIKIIETEYRLKKFKTLLINKEYKLIQRDKIVFICDECKREFEEKFAFNKKFFGLKQNCRTCDISKTKLIKYGSKNGFSQIEKSVMNKYGVRSVFQLDFVKEKIEKTFMKKYNAKNNFGRSEVRKKLYNKDGSYKNNRNKAKMTNIEKYGVENVSQLKEIKEKKKKTCLKNYGVENIFQDRILMEKLMFAKYGVKHPLESKMIKNKMKQNFLKHWGVEYPGQHPEIHRKQMRSFKHKTSVKIINNNLYYQTKPELEYIVYCQNNNIDIYNGPSIPYIFKGKKHIYHIDFETDKYVVEIKASHIWYKQNLVLGKIEAKNKAAKKYAASINKEFLFLLDVKDYKKYMENYNVR